ncbi:MAG: class II aldolase/adducin family protein [Candidatus Aminicenantes bacterium]|nr:class II aldolase/adducin family protein [Candidatus Aminicenantes bacterium]
MNDKTGSDKFDHLHLQRLLKRGLTFIPPVNIIRETGKEHTGKNIFEFTLAEPYSTISRYFLEMKYEEIIPVDSESGLFLPRIPVSPRTGSDELIKIVDKAGAVIPSDGHIITGSSEGPESLFTLFSIACFSLFVKFFHTILRRKSAGDITVRDYDYLDLVRTYEHKYTPAPGETLIINKKNIPLMIMSAGRSMVSRKLVDSIFGNISRREGNYVYISESGSFLDDLNDRIVKLPLIGSVKSTLQPSSELEVHRNIYKATEDKTVIHGHPLFTVILSLDSQTIDSPVIGEIPVVSAESGSGLEYLVPEMIRRNGNVVAKGHGIFCSGNDDFDQSLNRMAEIENCCREEYFKRLL